MFLIAGTPGFVQNESGIQKIVEDVAHWYVLEKSCAAINQFRDGLKILGVLDSIKAYPDQFKPLFCFGSVVVTAEMMNGLFAIEYSEKGSNRRAFEENVISYWLDFLQDVEEGESDVMMPEVLFFFSGCKSIPPLGFIPRLKYNFFIKQRKVVHCLLCQKETLVQMCYTCPLFTNNTQLSKEVWSLGLEMQKDLDMLEHTIRY